MAAFMFLILCHLLYIVQDCDLADLSSCDENKVHPAWARWRSEEKGIANWLWGGRVYYLNIIVVCDVTLWSMHLPTWVWSVEPFSTLPCCLWDVMGCFRACRLQRFYCRHHFEPTSFVTVLYNNCCFRCLWILFLRRKFPSIQHQDPLQEKWGVW